MANSSSTSSFKRYGKALLSGAIVFVLMNVLLAYGMRHYDGQSEVGRSISDGRYHRIPADVIFLGDSRAHEGLDPEVFAAESAKTGTRLAALNLGAPGMQGPF
jgi:hypothetical protein